MTAIDMSFGGVDLPNVDSYGAEVSYSTDSLALLDRDGNKSPRGRMIGRVVQVTGKILKTSAELMETAWANLLQAIYDAEGGVHDTAYLIMTDDGRKIAAQCIGNGIRFGSAEQNMFAGNYWLRFRSRNTPFWEGTVGGHETFYGVSTNDVLTYPAADIGDASAYPLMSIHAPTVPLDKNISILNNTAGAESDFRVDVDIAATKTLIVNMGTRLITNDGVDVINDVLHPDSDWWPVKGGVANSIRIAFGGGATDVVVAIGTTKFYYNF